MTRAKIDKLHNLVLGELRDELEKNLKKSFVNTIVDKFGTNGIIFTAIDQYQAHGRYVYPITHKHYKDLVNYLVYRIKQDMKTRLEIDKEIYGLNAYDKAKARARQEAIDWQHQASTQNLSYGEIVEKNNYFERLGKRYGLVKEFRENGVI